MSTCMVVFSDAPRIGRALHFAVWVARSASTFAGSDRVWMPARDARRRMR